MALSYTGKLWNSASLQGAAAMPWSVRPDKEIGAWRADALYGQVTTQGGTEAGESEELMKTRRAQRTTNAWKGTGCSQGRPRMCGGNCWAPPTKRTERCSERVAERLNKTTPWQKTLERACHRMHEAAATTREHVMEDRRNGEHT